MKKKIQLQGTEPATRWPQKEDCLFPDTGLARDAFLAGDPAERWYRLPQGYKLAGDVLLGQVAASSADRSNLIYPALFCYRQSIELFLKVILERFGKRAKFTHDLEKLWKAFLQLLNERGQDQVDGLPTVEKLILEMHEADEKSDTFRFSTDSSGVGFAFGDRRLDVTRLADIMQGLQNFFECCHLALWEQGERDY